MAQYARPGGLLLVPADPGGDNFSFARENLRRLRGASDAAGRPFDVIPFDVTGTTMAGPDRVEVPYLNCYPANGAVVVPVAGVPSDDAALQRLREVFPDRSGAVLIPRFGDRRAAGAARHASGNRPAAGTATRR